MKDPTKPMIFLLLLIFVLVWSSISLNFDSNFHFISKSFDPANFPLMNQTNNLVSNGGFSASSDGYPIIDPGKLSAIISGDGVKYWLAEPGQCIQIDLINSNQVMQLACDGTRTSVIQIVTAPNSGTYYFYMQFTATQPASAQRQYFTIFINNGQIERVKPNDHSKHYLVIEIYLFQGENSISLNGESLDAGSNVWIDNVAIYPKIIPTVQITDSHIHSYLALSSGATYGFSSVLKDNRDPPLIDGNNSFCSKLNKQNQYFQINAPEIVRFTSILIQGSKPCSKLSPIINSSYIKTFKITYTLDGETWITYNNDAVFTANSDPETVVTVALEPAIVGKSIKIIFLEWNKRICTRLDARYTTIA